MKIKIDRVPFVNLKVVQFKSFRRINFNGDSVAFRNHSALVVVQKVHLQAKREKGNLVINLFIHGTVSNGASINIQIKRQKVASREVRVKVLKDFDIFHVNNRHTIEFHDFEGKRMGIKLVGGLDFLRCVLVVETNQDVSDFDFPFIRA